MSCTFAYPNLTPESTKPLDQAILETLAYSDIFDYPLILDELHRYLVISATKEEVENCILNMNQVRMKDEYYFLADRAEIVEIRKSRTEKSRRAFNRALFYGKLLGILPFVRMVSITGSLAVLNFSKTADMDYMLVTEPQRLWLARAFAVTFGRLMRLFGDRICINLLISENNLHWTQHDLYSAREICQMIPVSDFHTYNNFRIVNLWVKDFLPNVNMESTSYVPQIGMLVDIQKQTSILQKIFEIPFFGKLGDLIENQVMNIQLKLIAKNFGDGEETKFTPDICQGNFHHHKKWTQMEYEKRLVFLMGER